RTAPRGRRSCQPRHEPQPRPVRTPSLTPCPRTRRRAPCRSLPGPRPWPCRSRRRRLLRGCSASLPTRPYRSAGRCRSYPLATMVVSPTRPCQWHHQHRCRRRRRRRCLLLPSGAPWQRRLGCCCSAQAA
ncbi:unnamed protein product, partial [Ectocarpus sp. 13 AM-2016]